jgi:hypothetical protein
MVFQKYVPSSRAARSGAVRCMVQRSLTLQRSLLHEPITPLHSGLPGLGSPHATSAPGRGSPPPTSAPGLPRRFAFRRVQVLVANKMDLESDRRVALEQVWAFGLGWG